MRMYAAVFGSPAGYELVARVERGDMAGMSFGGLVGLDSWYEQPGTRVPLRVIEHVLELDTGDPAGREHARHFRTRAEAQRWLDGIAGDLVQGTYVDPRPVGSRSLTTPPNG